MDKYVAFDVETTGLRYKSPNYLLMVSMIVDDLSNVKPLAELPHYTVFVDPRDSDDSYVHGEPYALQMNAWILKEICSKTPRLRVVRADNLETEICKFIGDHFGKEKATLAGKNVGSFDYQFLPEEAKALFRHRHIDVGNLYFDFTNDKVIPDLAECKKRADINSPVAHDAYEDALDVVRCVRFYAELQKARALDRSRPRNLNDF